FLYVSPERLETALFKEYLPGMGINLIAVDEAHCISQWGYDFRPPYLRIAALREELPGIPILALTASATPEVQADICEKLQFEDQNIFRQSFERPNLSYSIFPVDSRITKIIEILKKVPGTGIVYCKSRKRTKEISELLQLQNISADYYHAGLSQDERNNKQEAWLQNRVRVIVCTNAFGMGSDKPDVRTVIHADTPDCLENYYQEAGRGGRDGKKSYAVLLSDDHELNELKESITVRFPPLPAIREVYQAVANYLQLGSGTGAGKYFEFDMADFLRKFKLNSHATLYALKALEQDGWLAFNEQVFLPSTVRFNATKAHLFQFEKDEPLLDPLIKTLLRSYEGIFDHTCFISELLIAQLLRKDQEEVKKELDRLHDSGIIEYSPRKDKPQLYFLRNRIKTDDLSIDLTAYKKRKDTFEARVKQMILYVKEENACRSRLIGVYFGDSEMKDCGICDNCLRRKAIHLSKEEFTAIHLRLLDFLTNEPVAIKDVLSHLGAIKKEKVWKVIDFLLEENKIVMEKNGSIKRTI
ncbi:MAG TPA: RecQ family ATP-dependent DNA helicase, partial [Chitinophagaceae bacterium]|nr:RecQ family ATP-dependent DNA helicase [Chitinophagaceae bacterium]